MWTKEHKAEYMRKWRSENKAQFVFLKKKSYLKHRDRLLEEKREEYRKDPERVLRRNRAWAERNPEFAKTYRRSFNFKISAYKHLAKYRGFEFLLTEDEFRSFWNKPCHYCEDKIETVGLDRVDNSVGYRLGNVVPCCSCCNQAKNDLTQKEFLDRCARVTRVQQARQGE